MPVLMALPRHKGCLMIWHYAHSHTLNPWAACTTYLGGIMIYRRAVSSRFSQVPRVACLSVILGVACLMMVACAGIKTREADDLRSTVVALAAKKAALPEVPGLSVALLRKGEDTPVCAAFGNTSLENPTPMTTASRF